MCDTPGFNREAPSGEEVSLKNYAISARASPKKMFRNISANSRHTALKKFGGSFWCRSCG